MRYLAAKPVPAVVHLQLAGQQRRVLDGVPTTAQAGSPHLGFDLAIERAGNNTVTYWLTIHNLTGDRFDFEARYNFLN